MEEIKVKILAKDSIQKEENILLGELVRGEPIDPRSEFGFRETKVGQNASLFLLDEHFEFEANCNVPDLPEKHALGFLEGDKLRIIEIPYYFHINKRVKTDSGMVIGRRGSMNYQEKKELIVQEIGTTKSKKILKHQKTKIIDDKKISSIDEINGIFNEKAATLHAEKEQNDNLAQKAKVESLKTLLPAFNKNARFAHEIYSFESIVNKKDLEQIDKKIFLEMAQQGYLQVPVQMLCQKSGHSFENMEDNIVKAWCYLNFMFSIFPIRKISKSIKDLAKEKRVSPTILQYMVKNFYEPVGASETPEYIQTKSSALKFIAYMVVLILLLCEFKFEIGSVFSYFKMHEKE